MTKGFYLTGFGFMLLGFIYAIEGSNLSTAGVWGSISIVLFFLAGVSSIFDRHAR